MGGNGVVSTSLKQQQKGSDTDRFARELLLGVPSRELLAPLHRLERLAAEALDHDVQRHECPLKPTQCTPETQTAG